MDATTKPFRRAAVPADALTLGQGRTGSGVVDLAADLRTLTAPMASVLEQRDQALRALSATVAALRLGWPVPELFAVGTLTKYNLVPAPGADPHQVLTGAPWWASPRDAAVRDLHPDDDVDGGLRRLAQLPVSEHAPEYARWLVTALDADWHLPAGVVDDARLVASELVTNVVRHAKFPPGRASFPIEVEWSADRAELTIAVSDPDPALPRFAAEPETAAVLNPGVDAGEGGAGLLIVRALTVRWDVDGDDTGKTVLAVLSATPRGGAR
jgi:anti-sigma regulatory factor (Ser/Thr protein kinase)